MSESTTLRRSSREVLARRMDALNEATLPNVIKELVRERLEQRRTRREVSRSISQELYGHDRKMRIIDRYESGDVMPTVDLVSVWAGVLGLKLQIVRGVASLNDAD
jgi:ribosome-binding protein aMBF1 (putative translation factor)